MSPVRCIKLIKKDLDNVGFNANVSNGEVKTVRRTEIIVLQVRQDGQDTRPILYDVAPVEQVIGEYSYR